MNFQPPDPVCKFCDDTCSGTCEGAREQAEEAMTNNQSPGLKRYYWSEETGKVTTKVTRHGWHREMYLATEADQRIAELRGRAVPLSEWEHMVARIAALEAALVKYGDHESLCKLRYSSVSGEWVGRDGPCICGFDAIKERK